MGEELLFYLNLTGELYYIISHRMEAQNIDKGIQNRVIHDLAESILDPKSITEFLTGGSKWLNLPFPLLRDKMRLIAHSSIMTLNEKSMDRAFELTLIATKFQFSTCQFPTDILLIVLNHLDSIKKFVFAMTDVLEMIKDVHLILISNYGTLSGAEMQKYRLAILDFLVDVRLKMTNLMRVGLQTESGDFVREPYLDNYIHPACTVPGLIQIYNIEEHKETDNTEVENEEEKVYIEEFNIAIKADGLNMSRGFGFGPISFRPHHSLDFDGDRIITLGLTTYHDFLHKTPQDTIQHSFEEGSTLPLPYGLLESIIPESKLNEYAVPGLNLCGKMLGIEDDANNLNLTPLEGAAIRQFTDLNNSQILDEESPSINVVNISVRREKNTLADIMKEIENFNE